MIRESFTAADAGTRKSLLASEGDAYDTLTMRVSLYFSHAEEDTDQNVFEGRQRTFLGQFQTRDKSMLLKIFSQVIFFFASDNCRFRDRKSEEKMCNFCGQVDYPRRHTTNSIFFPFLLKNFLI